MKIGSGFLRILKGEEPLHSVFWRYGVPGTLLLLAICYYLIIPYEGVLIAILAVCLWLTLLGICLNRCWHNASTAFHEGWPLFLRTLLGLWCASLFFGTVLFIIYG